MVPKYRLYVRRFLNRRGHHAGAYVLASVSDTSTDQAKDAEAWIEFEIGDCARRVSLDFPLRDRSSRLNSVAKARLLAEVTARFAEALEAEADLAATRRTAGA